MARTKPWELSDAVWERAAPLLPAQKPHPKGGRPPRDDRQMLGAMLYVLRTGIQWNALPHEIGASTTVYDRFRAGERAGVFARLWAAGLGEFDELVGIDWEWQRLDGVMTQAPFGRAATAEAEGIGHTPTDRGKHGTKRRTLSEGHGLPLAGVVAGAHVHDLKLAAPTLDAVVVERPLPTGEQPQHRGLDAGYDYDLPRFAAEQRGYRTHIRPRGEERTHAGSCDPRKRPRRWVVERRHSWLNRSRRLVVRWEQRARTYLAFVQLACALICFQHCARWRLCTASPASQDAA
jgi:putative transposase